MCGIADAVCLLVGLALFWATVEGDAVLDTGVFTAAFAPRALLAAAAISTSHVLYAAVWYFPCRFASASSQLAPRATPVAAFSALVTLAKIVQNVGLLWWAGGLLAAAEAAPLSAGPPSVAAAAVALLRALASATAARWSAALLLIGCGQLLNVSIYRAIGADGVYYGFELGAPVPWSSAFPFSAGFRHPQYVGGVLSQLGIIALVATRATLAAGLLPLTGWWLLLYALTSWMEAAGDNDAPRTN